MALGGEQAVAPVVEPSVEEGSAVQSAVESGAGERPTMELRASMGARSPPLQMIKSIADEGARTPTHPHLAPSSQSGTARCGLLRRGRGERGGG